MTGKIQIHQVAIALLTGIIIGLLVQRCAFHSFAAHHPRHHGDMKKHILNRLDRDLNLNAEQKVKMEAIFDAKGPRMKALHEKIRPEFEALHRETQAEIAAILNPEQQKKFDEINTRMEKRFKEHDRRM